MSLLNFTFLIPGPDSETVRVASVTYNDVTHLVVSGTVGSPMDVGATGQPEGYEIYRQDGVNEYWSVRVSHSNPYAYVVHVDIADPIVIDDIVLTPSMNGVLGTATINATGIGTLRYAIDASEVQVGNVFIDLPPGVYTARVTRLEDDAFVTQQFTIIGYNDLVAITSGTPTSAPAAADGSITTSILSGSGDYTVKYLVDDETVNLVGPEVSSTERNDFVAGLYNIEVTDNITGQVVVLSYTVIDPVIEVPEERPGTFLEFPLLNCLKWVVDPISSNRRDDATLDNVLFKNIVYTGFSKSDYSQKVCQVDNPLAQFNSDYVNHTIVLKDCHTNEIVKTFPTFLREQNIGAVEDFQIAIKPHLGDVNKSRVYFNVGAIPIPLSVNDSFEVLDNVDGFNGVYSITAIETDSLLNYQYLVINTPYIGVGISSAATGRFLTATVEWNVFESEFDLGDVADGCYYGECTASDNLGNTRTAVTEPILLAAEHEDCNLITYRNEDNADDISWTTGYIGKIRVESLIGHKRLPGGERTTTRNSDFGLVKTSSKKIRGILFEIEMAPPWLIEKLSCIFDLDFFKINNVEYQTSDGLSEPEWPFQFKFGTTSIKLEQKNWFRKYNSDDISSVSEGGFIVSETGFIKR